MSVNLSGETCPKVRQDGQHNCVASPISGGHEQSELANSIVNVAGASEANAQEEGVVDAPARSAGASAALLHLFKTSQPESKQAVATHVAKKAETLFQNLSHLIQRRGINCIGFLTMTFVENLTCRREAQRRFNSLATHFFRSITDFEYIAAVERQERGAIHYHCPVALPWDIRTGFDFDTYAEYVHISKHEGWEAAQVFARDYDWFNACPALRRWWANLRTAAAVYKFGRCETFPIYKSAEACARYVGGYVGKEFAKREPRDKGLRTIRYGVKERIGGVGFGWAEGPGRKWRFGLALFVAFLGLQDEPDIARILGVHWQYQFRKTIALFANDPERVRLELAKIPARVSFVERCYAMHSLTRFLALDQQLQSLREWTPEKTAIAERWRNFVHYLPTPEPEVPF
jgi:hypothetical protein